MNKSIKFMTLLTALMVGLGLQAEAAVKHTATGNAWVLVVNKSGSPMRVWWGGHRTLFDKDNFVKIPNGGSKEFWLHDVEAMRGPLFFQQANDAREYAVKTTNLGGINYEVIHSVDKAYFYPINENRGFLNAKKTLEIAPGGAYDFRVRQTWPVKLNIFEAHPWVKATATTYNPLTGAYKLLSEIVGK